MTLQKLIDDLIAVKKQYGDIGVCLWGSMGLFWVKKLRVYGCDRNPHTWCSIDIESNDEMQRAAAAKEQNGHIAQQANGAEASPHC